MDHYSGVNETERYNNDLLNETRKTNQLQEETNVLLRQLISKIDVRPQTAKQTTNNNRKKVQ